MNILRIGTIKVFSGIMLLSAFAPLALSAQNYGLHLDYITKDNTPACLDMFDNNVISVDGVTYFISMLDYTGASFNMPSHMSAPVPARDFATKGDANRSMVMVSMKSDDGNFCLLLSSPKVLRDSVTASFGKSDRALRLHYDWKDSNSTISIPATDPATYNPNLQHHLHITGDGVRSVKTCTQDYARSMFNADTVKIYDAPEEYVGKLSANSNVGTGYSSCKVIVIEKHDRGYIYGFCLFTPAGASKADKYIDSLKDMVWYDDEYTPSWRKTTWESESEKRLKTFECDMLLSGACVTLPDEASCCLDGAIRSGDRTKVLVSTNTLDRFAKNIIAQTQDGLIVCEFSYISSEKDMSGMNNPCTLGLTFRNLPETFLNSTDWLAPAADSFKAVADKEAHEAFGTDTLRVFRGKTSAQKRFLMQTTHDDGDEYLEPLDNEYPQMEIWEAEKDGKIIRLYRFMKSASGKKDVPKIIRFT